MSATAVAYLRDAILQTVGIASGSLAIALALPAGELEGAVTRAIVQADVRERGMHDPPIFIRRPQDGTERCNRPAPAKRAGYDVRKDRELIDQAVLLEYDRDPGADGPQFAALQAAQIDAVEQYGAA
ncbi:MAG: hypothetical protein NVSMB64_21800 [Candidatus Velthaea sp.]